ncbi:MAG: sulfotransferase [Gemmatimonadota bacterium]
MPPQPPLIVIGMHRSGTSLLTRLLEALGLFVGRRKEGNHEAVFFLRLNDWLLRESGGAWHNPTPLRWVLEAEPLRSRALNHLAQLCRSWRAAEYLGWRRYASVGSLQRIPFPWGWKDPRNTFTAPLWLDLFPEATVVHIWRHGVDVARSLRRREEAHARETAARTRRKRLRRVLLPRRTPELWYCPRCVRLECGFALWEQYVTQARRVIDSVPDRALEIRYEDLVSDPYPTLHPIIASSGLSPDERQLRKISSQVDSSRTHSFGDDPELTEFAARMTDRVARIEADGPRARRRERT